MPDNSLKRATATDIRATNFSRSHINTHLQSSVPNKRCTNVHKSSQEFCDKLISKEHQSGLRSNSIENTISIELKILFQDVLIGRLQNQSEHLEIVLAKSLKQKLSALVC